MSREGREKEKRKGRKGRDEVGRGSMFIRVCDAKSSPSCIMDLIYSVNCFFAFVFLNRVTWLMRSPAKLSFFV